MSALRRLPRLQPRAIGALLHTQPGSPKLPAAAAQAARAASAGRLPPPPALAPAWQTPPSRAVSTGSGSAATAGTGFSYPGPRKLSEVVKLQLLTKHGAGRVREIWEEYHARHKTAVGDVLDGEEWGLLRERSGRCPMFVLPVPREGGYFTVVVQFQGKQCFMTFLEEFRRDAGKAVPWLTVTVFDELLQSKGLALVRGEAARVSRGEAKVLLELLKQFYLGPRRLYDAVVAFNEEKEKFDFRTVLRVAGIA